ncbi:hypothetical protein KVV02_005781 [Mortierella alpina]|uniref:Uncharacterized protein n=1 Tax=Mortierella alpina TaxID=64518 RepID=A0A9P8A7T5_MORAP|nr:hypothetical protein KVV02_005781 [Mortierella alpina]
MNAANSAYSCQVKFPFTRLSMLFLELMNESASPTNPVCANMSMPATTEYAPTSADPTMTVSCSRIKPRIKPTTARTPSKMARPVVEVMTPPDFQPKIQSPKEYNARAPRTATPSREQQTSSRPPRMPTTMEMTSNRVELVTPPLDMPM